MNYKELRKNRHILYHLHLEKKKTFREKFFLLRNRIFHFSGKFVIFSESPLISDCKEIVQPRELQKTKKKQTYLISPTSREKEDFQRRLLFTDKEKFQVFRKVAILAIPRLK